VQGRASLRRLHSILGIVPVGAFVLFHLVWNTAAVRGADAYDALAERLQRFPLAVAIETFLIALPMAVHGVYGLYLTATTEPGAPRPTRVRRAISRIQRATGILLFVFVLFHLWTTRLVQIRDHESLDLFRIVQAALASPWIRAFYAAAIVSAAFHLASGIWSAPVTWGLDPGRRARAVWVGSAIVVFVVISAAGLVALTGFDLPRR
jgi:succinate dehydrogenase / fumarate reductase, cytochrome b subunit